MRLAVLLSIAVLWSVQPARAQEKVEFTKSILPILEENCFRCHGARKKKGGLRLHTPTEILDGEVIEPGKPEDSELFIRISLPEDDEDIMPPSGEPLEKEQIELIKLWISQGGEFDEAAKQLEAEAEAKVEKIPEVAAASDEALGKVRELGALVLPLAQNTELLNVDFRAVADQIGDEQLAALAGISEQLRWLNLARSKVTDAGLAQLAGMKHLSRLHLEQTGVSDAGLAHLSELAELEYLNLYGTQVSDAGLAHLESLPKLEKLFLWQSKVTYEGSKVLEGAMPGIQINLGWDNPGVQREKAEKELAAVLARKEEAVAQEEEAKKALEEAQRVQEEAKKALEAAAKREEELRKKIEELGGPKVEEKPAEGEGEKPAEGEAAEEKKAE